MSVQRSIIVKALLKGKVTTAKLLKKGIPMGSAWKTLSLINQEVKLKKERKGWIITYSCCESSKKKLLKLI